MKASINLKNKIMKKLILLLAVINLSINYSHSQSVKMDTLLGAKGFFSKFKPKEITANQKLSFNLKMNYTMKDKSGKTAEVCVYMNTKHGYIGMLHVKKGVDSFNPNAANFNLVVYSNSMKSLIFSNSKKGKKSVIAMPAIQKNEFQLDHLNLKREGNSSKKFTNLNSIGYAFNNGKTAAKDRIIMYLSDATIAGKYDYKNQLSYGGMGFYQINNKTVLNFCIERDNMNMTLTKIESVAVTLTGAEFKKEEMEGMDQAMEEMMKKLKK